MGQFSVEKPVAPGSALSGNQHIDADMMQECGQRLCSVPGYGFSYASLRM
jgi:hypothetical protein